jgi:dTDP-4-dehydrorhamnose 3,5-epimerase
VQIETTDIPDVKILAPRKFVDARGFFSETYNQRTLHELGIDHVFVQDNHSLSAERGTLRGLHYQVPPRAQAKLVRVARGSILDVCLDIRRGSPTFGRYVRVLLSADNWRQLLVPVGFAHGYITLEPNTEVIYKVTDYYSPTHERGLLWNDPALAIDWGVAPAEVVLSPRDRTHTCLSEASDLF